jgi:hypothetical protein
MSETFCFPKAQWDFSLYKLLIDTVEKSEVFLNLDIKVNSTTQSLFIKKLD